MRDPRLPFRALAFPMAEPVRIGLAAGVARAVREHANVKEGEKRPARRVSGSRRIRVGYVSPDFRVHPAAYLMQPILELHDRARFEVYAYSLTKGDGSEIRQRVERSVDVFRDESDASEAGIASRIAADSVDIASTLPAIRIFPVRACLRENPADCR